MYRKALFIDKTLNNISALAFDYGSIGWVAHGRGDQKMAEEMCANAISINAEADMAKTSSSFQAKLGNVCADSWQIERACSHWNEALGISERLADDPRRSRLDAKRRLQKCEVG